MKSLIQNVKQFSLLNKQQIVYNVPFVVFEFQVISKHIQRFHPALCNKSTVFLGTLSFKGQNIFLIVNLYTLDDFIPSPPLMTPQQNIIFEMYNLYFQRFPFLLGNSPTIPSLKHSSESINLHFFYQIQQLLTLYFPTQEILKLW